MFADSNSVSDHEHKAIADCAADADGGAAHMPTALSAGVAMLCLLAPEVAVAQLHDREDIDVLILDEILVLDEPAAGPREAGSVRYWLNILDDNRIPVVDKPVREGAQRGLIPPRAQRAGIIPRLTVSDDYEDNLTFAAKDRIDDLVTVFSPGVSYANTGDRWRLDLDYAFESAVFLRNSEFNKEIDAMSGELNGSYALTPNTQLRVLDIYRETRDPTEQAIPGAVTAFTRTRTNNLFVAATHALTRRSTVGFEYGNTLHRLQNSDSVDALVQSALANLDVDLNPRDRAGPTYQFRAFKFYGAEDQMAHTATLGFRRDFGDRLVARARAGAVYTGADSGRTFATGRVSLEASAKNAIHSLSIERDLTNSAGVGSLLVETVATASSLVRLARGLQGSAEFSYSDIFLVDQFEQKFEEINARLVLSYGISEHLWLHTKYTFVREIPEKEDQVTANSVVFSIVTGL